MDIALFQRWLADYDRRRSFDLAEPSQVTVHLMEEVGEIAREVLYLEGYKNSDERANAAELLSAEIGDAIVFLTKLAIHYGMDMDTVIANLMSKAEQKWAPDKALREMERYVQQRQEASNKRTSEWQARKAKSHIANRQSAI